MNGWIKLHRKLAEKAFYKRDSEMVHLWIHLLMSANHEIREEYLGGKPIKCNPGQFTTGRNQLVQATGINRSKIERILKKLEEIEQQIEQQTTSTNRLISICNWDEYQSCEQQIEQQVSNDRATSEQQVSTLQELKKEKNNKNIILDFEFLPEFESLLIEWFEYKKSRKESYKNKNSREKFYKTLIKYSNSNIDKATKIIDKSIANNWAGIFELNEQKQSGLNQHA